MRLLFIKPFQDTPDTVIYPREAHEVWSTTGERALKEGKAVEIPEGVDEEQFIQQTFENLKKKGNK